MNSECFFCKSMDIEVVRDYNQAFDFHRCNDCFSWYADIRHWYQYKYKKINGSMYILEENSSGVAVYEALVDDINENSQPDMLISLPRLFFVKKSTINKLYGKLEMHVNFR